MTTARDIVEAAWRRITKSSSEETVTAAEAQDLLEVLNDYLFTLEDDCAYTHYSLGLSDDLQTPPSLDAALKDVLTTKGAEEFGLAISRRAELAGVRGESRVLSVMMTPADLTVEDGLRGTHNSGRYDVDSG